MKSQKNTRQMRGFTLVEILTVIVIIGVLAAVLTISARYVQRTAATRTLTKHIETCFASCTALFTQRGVITSNSGFSVASGQTFSGTNFSTTNATVASAYLDFRQVLVANGFLQANEILWEAPAGLRGLTPSRSYLKYSTTAAGITSSDGVTWSRTPDAALTTGGGAAPDSNSLLLDQKIMACFLRTGQIQPSEAGVARTGFAMRFTIVVDTTFSATLASDLTATLGKKGYYITTTDLGNGTTSVLVVSPRLSY